MSMSRSILRNKKRCADSTRRISPYAKGTTLNKLASVIAEYIKYNSLRSAEKSFKEALERNLQFNHNDGEFRHYPPKGKPGCLEELLKLAVGKKLGMVIR